MKKSKVLSIILAVILVFSFNMVFAGDLTGEEGDTGYSNGIDPIVAEPQDPPYVAPDDSMVYNPENYKNPFAAGRVIVSYYEDAKVEPGSTIADIGIASLEDLNEPQAYDKGDETSGILQKLVIANLKDTSTDGVLKAIEILKQNPSVIYAEPDYELTIERIPNDPGYPELWGMEKIQAPTAWDRYTGNSSTIVGVIDTGIDYTHPDLAANMWVNRYEIAGNGIDDDRNGYIDDVYGFNFGDMNANVMDTNSHGTHVAGTIAAVGNNSLGVTGVCWNTKLAALKIMDRYGRIYNTYAIRALNYAKRMGITITNNSYGGGGYDRTFRDAISTSGLFVAAAGNYSSDNDRRAFYPASYDCANIISVAATDPADDLAVFPNGAYSNYGRNSVDIGAPGLKIYSTVPGGRYDYYSGTSMAAPHVTGAAALLRGYAQEFSDQEIKDILLKTADSVSGLRGLVLTEGRLNVGRALSYFPMQPGVYLYEYPNYSGRYQRVTADSPNASSWYIGDNNVSSIRIVGNYEVSLYENTNYTGNYTVQRFNINNFSDDPMGDNRASSIRITAITAADREGVYLYQHDSFRGRWQKFTADSPTPTWWLIGNDSASSIRVIGSWEADVYQHANYGGAHSYYRADDPSFRNDAIGNDRASSIRVRRL